MEKSDHYYIRRDYMRNLTVPTISEVKQELGGDLAEAFFSQCPDPLKPDMGLTPPLKGAGDDLWISPSDTLIGKVVLKPPLTNKHMKALTHQGILTIGQDVEIKFWNKAELDNQKALNELEEILLFMGEMQKRQAVQNAHRKEQARCAEEKEQMRIEFAEKLQEELQKLEKKLKAEYEHLMKIQKHHLEVLWQSKLEDAVAETVETLTKKFLEDLAKQEEQLLKKFDIKIKKEQIKRKLEVKTTQEQCQETFAQLRHQLECKNIANMMYILCMERRKCQEERDHMDREYQKQIEDLQANLTEKNVEITKLTHDLDEKIKQVGLREECMLEILRQYQKFINFALRASPTQAEFLLSIEKLMVFELTQALAKAHPVHGRRLAKRLLPWKADSKESSTSSKKSLIAEDHHSCYNETEPPVSSQASIKSDEYLPAFYFDKHMYVREEFRNMMSQGLSISPSNLLWNRDVENLMQVLRRSVTDMKEGESDSYTFGTRSSDHSLDQSPVFSPDRSRRSTVHFCKHDSGDLLFPLVDSASSQFVSTVDLHSEIPEQPEPPSDTMIYLDKEHCTRCTQTYLIHNIDDYSKKIDAKTKSASAVPLIGTVNSLELRKLPVKVKPSVEHDHNTLMFRTEGEGRMSQATAEALGILSVKDSLIMHRMSIKPTSKLVQDRDLISTRVVEMGRKSLVGQGLLPHLPPIGNIAQPSKISLARDSIILHKQSLIAKRQSEASEENTAANSGFRRRSNEPEQRSISLKKSSKSSPRYTKNIASPPGSQRISIQRSTDSISGNLRAPYSRISLSRDSLELLRSQSMISGGHKKRKTVESRESVEIKSCILGTQIQRLSPPISIKLDDDGSRVVKMSHIEIVPLKERESLDVKSETTSTPEQEDKNIATTDSLGTIYADSKSGKYKMQPQRDNFLVKPNAAGVMGDRKATEHKQKDQDFTLQRAKSMLGILKKHPSLTRLFTAGTL